MFKIQNVPYVDLVLILKEINVYYVLVKDVYDVILMMNLFVRFVYQDIIWIKINYVLGIMNE